MMLRMMLLGNMDPNGKLVGHSCCTVVKTALPIHFPVGSINFWFFSAFELMPCTISPHFQCIMSLSIIDGLPSQSVNLDSYVDGF